MASSMTPMGHIERAKSCAFWQHQAMFPNSSDSKKRAFVRGLWRGMASPVVLFSTVALPAAAEPAAFEPLPTRGVKTMADDWKRVGQYLTQASGSARNG